LMSVLRTAVPVSLDGEKLDGFIDPEA